MSLWFINIFVTGTHNVEMIFSRFERGLEDKSASDAPAGVEPESKAV